MKSVSLLFVTALVVGGHGPAAAVEGEIAAGKKPGNTITVRVFGLPPGASPKILVEGPGPFRKVVTAKNNKRVIRGLRPGKYTLLPRPAGSKMPISVAVPVRVTSTKGAVARLYYSKTGTR